MRKLAIKKLGLISYQEAVSIQKELQQELIAGGESDYLLVCTHPEVITYGRKEAIKHLTAEEDVLLQNNISVYKSERGGDITYHGPDQVILYPIINLNFHKRDVHWYLRQLEEVVIKTLEAMQLPAIRVKDKSGVWINNNEKISSLGVRLSRWCTMHGIALNVLETNNFELIVPCGLPTAKMTSVQQQLDIKAEGAQELTAQCQSLLIENFCKLFGYHQLDT